MEASRGSPSWVLREGKGGGCELQPKLLARPDLMASYGSEPNHLLSRPPLRLQPFTPVPSPAWRERPAGLLREGEG